MFQLNAIPVPFASQLSEYSGYDFATNAYKVGVGDPVWRESGVLLPGIHPTVLYKRIIAMHNHR